MVVDRGHLPPICPGQIESGDRVRKGARVRFFKTCSSKNAHAKSGKVSPLLGSSSPGHGSAGSAASPTGTDARRPQTWRKLPLPENPRPEGLFQERGGEKAVLRARAMPIPPGTWKPRPWWTQAGNLPRERPEGRSLIFLRRSARGPGQQAPRRGGRPARAHPSPSHTPSGPCPSIPWQGPPAGAGTRRPVTWDGPGRLPNTLRRQSAGRRRPARLVVPEGYLEMVPGGRSFAA